MDGGKKISPTEDKMLTVDELTVSITRVLSDWHNVVLSCVRDYYKKNDILNTRAFEFKYCIINSTIKLFFMFLSMKFLGCLHSLLTFIKINLF